MAYHEFNSVAEYLTALDQAIDDAMSTTMADKAAEAMQKSMDEYVYDRTPLYDNRRGDAGGLRAKYNLSPSYFPAAKTLMVEAVAPWQNKGFRYIDGRGTYGGDLSDVIENNGLYHMDATHFAQHAEEDYGNKRAEKDLQHAIIIRGF